MAKTQIRKAIEKKMGEKGVLRAKEMREIIRDIAKKHKVSERAVYWYLEKLIKEGEVIKIGNKRGAVYTIKETKKAEEEKIKQIEKMYSPLLKYKPTKLITLLHKNKKIYSNLFDMLVFLRNHYERVSNEMKTLIEKALNRNGWSMREVYYILETAEFQREYKVYDSDAYGTKKYYLRHL